MPGRVLERYGVEDLALKEGDGCVKRNRLPIKRASWDREIWCVDSCS